MVKRTNKTHRRQTSSELRKKKKASHTAGQRQAEFVHPSIKAAWNKRRTLRQNYVALGLSADPNDHAQRERQRRRIAHVDIDATDQEVAHTMARAPSARDGDDSISDDPQQSSDDSHPTAAPPLTAAATALHSELSGMQRLSEAAPAYEVKSMSLNEQRRLQRLIANHGTDVHAMSRDIRLNIMQDTTAHLRKRLALYHRLQSA